MRADEDVAEMAQPEVRDRLHWFQLDRRDFLKLCGGGLLVVLEGPLAAAQEAGRRFRDHALPTDVNAWIHIDEHGAVTVFTGKVEVGQNIRTSLSQVVAEELHAPLASIRLVMADTALVPVDGGTSGSRTNTAIRKRLNPNERAVSTNCRSMSPIA